MRIAGIDPGMHTGLVLLDVPDDAPPFLVSSAQPEGAVDEQLPSLIEAITKADLVVYESFVPRMGKAMTPDWISPTYIIGAVRALAWDRGVETIGRTPAENKSACTDEVLKRLDLWGPQGYSNRHQRDASRVVVGWLKGQRHIPTLKKGWPQ